MRTEMLMLRRALGYAQPEEYIEWATGLLCAEVDGTHLRILAGLNARFDGEDVERYFLHTCDDLGLQPLAAAAAPLELAQLIQATFVRGEITAADAIHMMAKVYQSSEYSETLLSPGWG